MKSSSIKKKEKVEMFNFISHDWRLEFLSFFNVYAIIFYYPSKSVTQKVLRNDRVF